VFESKIAVLFAVIMSCCQVIIFQLFIIALMLCRADMADQLAKVKDVVENQARQDEADLEAKKSALLDAIKKHVNMLEIITITLFV